MPTDAALRRGCGGRASSPAGGLGAAPKAVGLEAKRPNVVSKLVYTVTGIA